MAKLSQITENSWFMKTNSDITGLLIKKDKYTFLTKTNKETFDTLDDIASKYGKISYIEREVEIASNIDGFPVRHKDIEVISSNPPIFVKKTKIGSNVEFYAGYWSIKHPNGWGSALCPKVSTVKETEHEGPFRTKLECTNNNNILNTRTNVARNNTSS